MIDAGLGSDIERTSDTPPSSPGEGRPLLTRFRAYVKERALRTTHWLPVSAALLPIAATLAYNAYRILSWDRSSGGPAPEILDDFTAGLALSGILLIAVLLAELFRRDRASEAAIQAIGEQVRQQYEMHQKLLQRVIDATQLVSNFGDKFLRLQARDPTGIDFGEFAKEVMRHAEEKLDGMVRDQTFTLDIQSPPYEYENLWLAQLMRGPGSFKTVSNLTIWSNRNLGFHNGVDSRYLFRQIKMCRHVDYHVLRVFVVPSVEMLEEDPHGGDVAKAAWTILSQYQTQVEVYAKILAMGKGEPGGREGVEGEGNGGTDQSRIEEIRSKYQTKVLPVSHEEYRGHFEGEYDLKGSGSPSGNFALIESTAGASVRQPRRVVNTVSYMNAYPTPPSTWPEYEIRSISFTAEERTVSACAEAFDLAWNSGRAMDISAYLESLSSLREEDDGSKAHDET